MWTFRRYLILIWTIKRNIFSILLPNSFIPPLVLFNVLKFLRVLYHPLEAFNAHFGKDWSRTTVIITNYNNMIINWCVNAAKTTIYCHLNCIHSRSLNTSYRHIIANCNDLGILLGISCLSEVLTNIRHGIWQRQKCCRSGSETYYAFRACSNYVLF